MWSHRLFLRRFDAGGLIEIFLVSAVASILTIRFFLRISGYPTLGGESLHIAHMLWGGLLMLVAMILLLSFLGRHASRAAALIGGIGFGTFIDEVGKFVTHDNDYFFQPAISVIYGIFILTFLSARALHGRSYTRTEYLLNALHELEEVALRDLDEYELRRALRYLERSDPDHPLVPVITELLSHVELVPVPSPGPLSRLRGWLRDRYRSVTQRRAFAVGLVVFFAGQFLLRLAHVVFLLLGWRFEFGDLSGAGWWSRVAGVETSLGFVDWAQLCTSLLSGVFVGWGIALLTRSRLAAYGMFKRSLLVTIFLTQVLMFYEQELSALVGLAFNILVLLALQVMMQREQEEASG